MSDLGSDRHSIEKLIATEHRRLDSIFEEVLGALREGDEAAAVRDAFARLREHVESHVSLEDRLYYPALRALRPAHRDPLLAITAAHEVFRARLAEIAASIEQGAFDAVDAALQAFATSFGAHESAEERLLHQIDAELKSEAGTTAR
jgi:hemerythrin